MALPSVATGIMGDHGSKIVCHGLPGIMVDHVSPHGVPWATTGDYGGPMGDHG